MSMEQIPWKLILRNFKGELSADESRELDQWLSDSSHRELYEELYRLWLRLMKEGASYTSEADKLWERMQQRMYHDRKAATARHHVSFRRWMYVAASVLILLSVGYAGHRIYSWNELNHISQHYAAVSGKALFQLPDGSTVWLNKGATLSYTFSPLAAQRQVTLQGEALFEVTHNETRPFVVQCADMEVKVVGTRFNIDAPTDTTVATVSLLNGSVVVSTPHEMQTMTPGQRAVYNKTDGTLEIHPVDVSIDSSWAAECLSIHRKTLRQTAAYLEQWFGVTILVSSDVKDDQAYTITVNRDDTVEEILHSLSLISAFNYDFIDKNIIKIVQP